MSNQFQIIGFNLNYLIFMDEYGDHGGKAQGQDWQETTLFQRIEGSCSRNIALMSWIYSVNINEGV